MFNKIRPLIFKLDPEFAHSLAIKALKTNLFPKQKISEDLYLKSTLFGKEIKNPIGIAAGFDKDAEVYNSLFNLGFGFVEVGTVTPLKQYGNKKPRVFRLENDKALINRLGFNNSGSNNVSKRIKKNKPIGILGVNIGPNWDSKDRVEDYLIGFKKFHNLADYITINISSPNTENLRDFHNLDELENLLGKIFAEKKKLSSKIPIALKVSPDINNEIVKHISKLLIEYKVNALIVSNTTDQNRDNLKDHQKFQRGGLSGKPLRDISNKLINHFFKNLNGQVKIIGVGGVDSGKSAYEKFLSGADFVQLYTGMVFRGPKIAIKINEELKTILKEKKIKNYSEIIGKL
jgi:dihydroorotate dehydrogenase